MHYIRNEIFMIIFSGMFLLCDMNANAQQIIKSSDTNDFRIGDSNDTYYIYDDLGLLRFVLSPSYQEEANLEKYGYEYRYDQCGRCVWKRLPGCEYLQLWYDNADNLMFSQDGEQRKKGIYVFYLYDFVKRQVLQGTTTAINSSCPSAIVAFNVSDAGICRSGYSSANDLGLKKEQLQQANYYDNHAFINGQLEKQATSQNLVSNQQASEQYSKGSLTGTVCMATDGKPLVSVYYHDLRGQVIASKQTMPDDVLLSQNMTYSFTKQPLEIISELTKNGMSATVMQTNSYNKHNDKIETMTLKVGNVTRTVSSYSYNDISRLLSIKRSGNVLRGYDFAYDGLNRLEESTYSEGAGMSQNKNRYSENILSYSPNGSIERLQRYGKKNNGTFGLIDDLMYSYNGNQIKAISDKAGSLLYDGSFDFKDGANADVEYFYDTNGALIKDLNKDISKIEYDILGNLKCITFSNGFKTKYIYDAAGNKLRTTHESVVANTTDYIGNFVLEDGKLSKYLFDGGYCSFDNNQNPTFHYYEKDHLGSVRMVVNENVTIEQVNHYYPFGGVYGDLSYNSEYQRNKYIGKEFDHMHGLDWYDHGARMYDAAKVVWNKVDPLSEIYFHFDPYLYCENNPIVMFDNTGLLGVRIVDMENKTITVSADYYVETQPYQVYTNVYSQKDVDDFNRLNSELNKLNLKVKSGEYAGFTVVFNLNFISAGNHLEVNNLVSLANEGTNTPMANSLRKSQDFEKYFDTKEYADGSTATVGGATDNNQNIVMNVNFDTEKNRLHEIFHTFGFEHPKMKGGSSGIMCYPPRSPDAKDAQLFGSDLLNDVLPFIKKEK